MKEVAEKCTFICFSCIYPCDIMIKKNKGVIFMTEEQKKYIKAEHDIIEARKSFAELNDVQKEALIKNIIGYETFNSLCNMMEKYFG